MLNPYQKDREQVEHEARAKIFWGDDPEEVIKFIQMQGISYEEACEWVTAMATQRAAAIRANGMRKILFGSLLVAVPVATYFIFASIGVMSLKLLGLAVAVGLWGGWILFKGIFMVAIPDSEHGDVADQ